MTLTFDGWPPKTIGHLYATSSCSYSPGTLNLGENQHFLWREIWQMTLENNMAPLLCNFKLCASFHEHRWIPTGVTVRKLPNRIKIDDFLSRVPWFLTEVLEKQLGISPMPHQAVCIITSPFVNLNWGHDSETVNWGLTSVTLTSSLRLWFFAQALLLSMVITPENFMMIRWHEHCQKGVIDGRIDRRTGPFTELLGRI